MLCCKNNNSSTGSETRTQGPPGDLSRESLAPKGLSSSLRRIATIGSIAIAPHVLCLLGGAGVIGGSFSFLNWCQHNSQESTLNDVRLGRQPKLPENFIDFPPQVSAQATLKLFEIEPRFHKVLAEKQREAGEVLVRVVFLEDTGSGTVSVVLCKNGSLCPCSKPALYEVGSRVSLTQPEQFQGQHDLLRVLYNGNK